VRSVPSFSRRWYADPKIVEAVFAIRADAAPAAPWPGDTYQRLANRFVGFASHEERLTLDAPVARRRSPRTPPSPGTPYRVLRLNHDGSRAVQWGPGICAYNVYPPYGHYEDHTPNLHRVMEAYLLEEEPHTVGGAEQRYVNELVLARGERPSDFFTFYPPIGDELQRAHARIHLEVDTATFPGGVVSFSLSRADDTADGVRYVLEVGARSVRALVADADAIVEWHNIAHNALSVTFEMSITDAFRRRLRQV
jgi:uncharacterized protein (TIGR04255 family)